MQTSLFQCTKQTANTMRESNCQQKTSGSKSQVQTINHSWRTNEGGADGHKGGKSQIRHKRKLTFKVEQEMTREQMPLISKQKSSQTPRTPEIGAKTRHPPMDLGILSQDLAPRLFVHRVFYSFFLQTCSVWPLIQDTLLWATKASGKIQHHHIVSTTVSWWFLDV